MDDLTKPITLLKARGFTFVDSPPITEAVALDLLTAMGLGNVVAAYRANKNAEGDSGLAPHGKTAADPSVRT